MGDFTTALEPRSAGQLGLFVTASVLLRDKSGNLLLVRSADADSWTIPSSVVTGDESPHDSVERLASQQLGLTAVAGQLLVISWTPATKDKNRAVVDFLFDGGTVHNEAALSAGAGTWAASRFFSWKQAENVVSAPLAEWLRSARTAREDGGATYIPGGL
jgi:ADP-ribose pyrophosphatase YjhB (NUDIX family)